MNDECTAEENLAKYIGYYENVNPELFARYGEDAYKLMDFVPESVYGIVKAGEDDRETAVDDAAQAIAEKLPAFTKRQVEELLRHFVDYYFDFAR